MIKKRQCHTDDTPHHAGNDCSHQRLHRECNTQNDDAGERVGVGWWFAEPDTVDEQRECTDNQHMPQRYRRGVGGNCQPDKPGYADTDAVHDEPTLTLAVHLPVPLEIQMWGLGSGNGTLD